MQEPPPRSLLHRSTPHLRTTPATSGEGGAPDLFVYRLQDHDGRLIYVGSTTNIQRRLKQHAVRFGDEVAAVIITRHANRDDMLAAESSLIRRHNPKHNRRGRTDLPDLKVNRWGTAREIEEARLERNRLAQEMYHQRKGKT